MTAWEARAPPVQDDDGYCSVGTAHATGTVSKRRSAKVKQRQKDMKGLSESECRRRCDQRANAILDSCKRDDRPVTSEHVCEAFRLWTGKKNYYRKRVNPEGEEFCRSMSMGLVKQHTGQLTISGNTKEYEGIVQLVNEYARTVVDEGFTWTTMTVNDEFASKRHRDSGNSGPSFILSVGNYTGGRLYAWPNDDRRVTLSSLDYKDAQLLQPKGGAHFDGTKAHETEGFRGWRVSVVLFTARCADTMTE